MPAVDSFDATRLAIAEDGEEWTRAEIDALMYDCARLIDDAFANGDFGAVMVPGDSAVGMLVGLLACMRTAKRAVPWRTDYGGSDYMPAMVGARLALAFEGHDKSMTPVARPLSNSPCPLDAVSGDLVLASSGTTGPPKGILTSFEKFMKNAFLAGEAIDIAKCEGWAFETDVTFTSALSHLMMAWQHGVPVFYLKEFSADQKIAFFRQHRAGYGGSPLNILRLVETIKDSDQPVMVMSSGDFLSPMMIERIHASFPELEIHKFYGLSELSGRFCHLPADQMKSRPQSAGKPLPGFDVCLKATDGSNVQTGEEGEVHASSDFNFLGYITSDGDFFAHSQADSVATGDLGVMDDEGYITLVGRVNDVFKVGGERVDRLTAEEALSDLLGDFDFAYLPFAHPLLGRAPYLFIAVQQGSSPPSFADVVNHIRARLPGRYVPMKIIEVPGELPRLSSGKLDQRAMQNFVES